MRCKNCGIYGHDSQGDSELCYIAIKDRCQRLEAALREISELPDSDYQDTGRTHRDVAKEALG